jgi:hypothetical protein
MAKKQATKSEVSYEANVEALFQSYLDSLNIQFPRCAELSYKRASHAGDLLWLAQSKLNAEVYLAERRAEDTDDNKVYDTKVERTRDWLDRMEMQHYGQKMAVDAAQMLCDYLADKE